MQVDQISAALSQLAASDGGAAAAAAAAAAAQQQQPPPRQSLQVKVFCADGSTVPVQVDDGMLASDLLDVLVETNHVQLQPTWAVVEHLPEMYMERYVSKFCSDSSAKTASIIITRVSLFLTILLSAHVTNGTLCSKYRNDFEASSAVLTGSSCSIFPRSSSSSAAKVKVMRRKERRRVDKNDH